MIFGKTNTEKVLTSNQRYLEMKKGIKRFAWKPITLADGRIVFLQSYMAYYHIGNVNGKLHFWSAGPSWLPNAPMFDAYDEKDRNQAHEHIGHELYY